VVAPLLAACGSGFHAETNQIYQTPYSKMRSIRCSGTAAPVLKIVARASCAVAASSIRIALPSQRAVQLADTGDVRVRGALDAGSYCTLTLTFAHAAPVNVEIPVVSASSDFRRVPLGPVPPPTTPSHSNPSRANP